MTNLDCNIYSYSTTIYYPGDTVNDIILIRSGAVNILDKNYNNISVLTMGGFFGEYQVIMDLKAGNYYRTQIS